MNDKLTSRVAVVTGASRGLGRAICLELAARGALVVVNHRPRSQELAEETLDLVRRAGGRAVRHAADVGDPAAVQAMMQDIAREYKSIDILVNNAGITRDDYFIMMRPTSWDEVMRVNLGGTFHCTKAVARGMCARGRGVVINIGSGAAVVAMPGQTNYSASKAALLGFTRCIARELAPKGVRVLTLAPGFFKTHMTEALDAKFVEETYRRTPLGRWGEPEELAKLVGFFASDEAAHITGQTIPIDGGRGCTETDYGL